MDMKREMLLALMGTDQATEVRPDIPLQDKVKYITKNIGFMLTDDLKEIGMMIVSQGCAHALSECAAGLVVNMDKLTDTVIGNMYLFIEYRVETQ